jgi:hypothetical protein
MVHVTIPLLHTKHHINPVFDYIREERISLEGSSSRGRKRNRIRNRSSVHFGGQSTKQTNTRLWTKYSLALRPVGKTAWIGWSGALGLAAHCVHSGPLTLAGFLPARLNLRPCLPVDVNATSEFRSMTVHELLSIMVCLHGKGVSITFPSSSFLPFSLSVPPCLSLEACRATT